MSPIPPPTDAPPRLAPLLPLPPYRYVPGRMPHPFRHPDGHNHLEGLGLPVPQPQPDQDWAGCLHHRYAIDLFHHRFYWECHEVWESLWLQLPQNSAPRVLIQALIQVAAGALKQHMGNLRARDRLVATAREKLVYLLGIAPDMCGVGLGSLMLQLDRREPWPRLSLHGFGPP